MTQVSPERENFRSLDLRCTRMAGLERTADSKGMRNCS